ncbi:MAG: NAD-dependent epimerase/dehydratase family protein [Actinomycetota bacterium]
MKVLVTGAAGFIGSHVVDALVAAGGDVVAVDALLPSVHKRPPVQLNARAELRNVDVRDDVAMRRAVYGVDAVCHHAGMVGLGTSFGDVTDQVSHNALGTAVLLRALHAAGFGGRFVLAGSMVVYGEGSYRCSLHGSVRPEQRSPERLGRGLFDSPCPHCGRDLTPVAVAEDAAADPRNVYAATKLHQEHLCASFARETRATVAALRYHNVYGPRMPRDTLYAGVASIFRSELESGRAPQVFEDGRQLRDFVHVADAAAANLAALSSSAGGAFNIATGCPKSVGDMATELGRGWPDAPAPEVTGRFRAGDVRHVFASPKRALRILGWSAKVPFDRGMRELAAVPPRA